MIYTASAIGVILVILFLLWRFLLPKVIDHLPVSLSSRLRVYQPLSTFEDAMENGFSTSAFDLSQNIAGDSRAGLDERTLTEVRRIMEREHCDFDEARLIHTNRMFKRNGIDPNGFPIDPKAITSLG